MKKIILAMTMALLFASAGFAQRSKRTSAFMYMEKGQLDKAKEKIDLAVKHEKTKMDPKTWLYYGRIYYSSPLPAFTKLAPNAAEKHWKV